MSFRPSFSAPLRSPELFLSAAPLLIIGTSRLSFALIAVCALLWTAAISICITRVSPRVFPQKVFFGILPLFLYSFVASIFLFVLDIFNPVLAQETLLIVLLAPAMFLSGGLCSRTASMPFKKAFGTALGESAAHGILFICFAILREPLGYGAISVPGGERGITVLFSFEDYVFPIQIISGGPGALLLLGYIFLIARLTKQREVYVKQSEHSGMEEAKEDE